MPKRFGFTLVELLVVISILAILSTVGMTVFRGVQKNARDAKRKEDVQTIAKAYEMNYDEYQKKYIVPASDSTNYTGGVKPAPPEGGTLTYNESVLADGSAFTVCAALEANPSRICGGPTSDICYCVSSTRGTYYASGGGGGVPVFPSSCDLGNSLNVNLIAYWNFDQQGATTVIDSSGNGYNGTFLGTTVPNSCWTTSGKLPWGTGAYNAGLFSPPPADNCVRTTLNMAGRTTGTISFWVQNRVTDDAKYSTLINASTTGSEGMSINKEMWDAVLAPTKRYYVYSSTQGVWAATPNNAVITGASSTAWQMITVTWDPTQATLYVYDLDPSVPDYKITDSSGINITTGTTSTWGNLLIGCSLNSNYGHTEIIDDVKVYSRVLSDSEIINLWNGGAGCVPTP